MKNKFYRTLIYTVFIFILWMLIFLGFSRIVSPDTFDGKVFAGAYAMGHAFEFACVLFILLVPWMVVPQKIYPAAPLFLGFTGTVYLVIDYIIFRQFRLHLTGSMLSMFFGPASGEIFVFPVIMYIQALLGLIGIVFVVWILWKAAGHLSSWKIKSVIGALGLLGLISAGTYHAVHAWASFAEYNPVTRQITALPLTFPLSGNRTLQKMGFQVPERFERFAPHLMVYPLEEIELGTPQTPNIVIIMLDGWRPETITEDIAPHITAFKEQALRFNEHNANSNHTRHGVFSFFYGLPGAYWDAAVTDTVGPVLVDTVLKLGYETRIFASAALTSPEFHKTVFSAVPDLRLYSQGKWTFQRDMSITREFLEFLENRNTENPFFSFLFYDCTHAYDYDAEMSPPKYLPAMGKNYLTLSPENKPLIWNQYKNSVVYVDMLVGEVLERLEQKNLMENTIIILTADHGEEFDDLGKGYWGHNGNYTKYQTQVPMLIHWPGKSPQDFNYRTSHVDMVPTLMEEIFGCTTSKESYTTGINLFEPEGRKFIYMQGDEYAIMTEDTITIFRKLGMLETVDLNYDPTDKRVPSELLREVLEEISRFKK